MCKYDFRLSLAAILLAVLFPGVLLSESIKGKIIDDESGNPVPGASVRMKHLASEKILGGKSDAEGKFFVKDLPGGDYEMSVTHVSFKTYNRRLHLENDLKIGKIALTPKPTVSETIDVVGKVPLAEQKGDTIQYNSAAYKTNPDASASDLVSKLPGMTVGSDGSVSERGEKVEQVYVDGKTFFGKDPQTALQTIPAEIIDKIEVFDEKSEQSQFTGFDDGNTTKTINLVTKAGKRDGWFGKISGGYGHESKYDIGGNINYFNGDTRISLVGLTNNVNKQNFSSEDLVGVMAAGGGRRPGHGRGRPGGGESFMVDQYGGITATNSFGINYSDSWGENIDVMGSYFFNMSSNENESSLERSFFDEQKSDQLFREESYSESDNMNHRINLKMDWKINENNSIQIRPRITTQANDGFSQTNSVGYTGTDTLNYSDYNYASDLGAINFSNDFIFRHKFSKFGRTVSVGLNTRKNTSDGNSNQFSETGTLDGISDAFERRSDFENDLFSYAARLDYTEPLFGGRGAMSMLRLSYTNSYQNNAGDQKAYDINGEGQDDIFNRDFSNTFESDYRFNRVDAGVMFRRGKEFFIMGDIGGQIATLDNSQTYPGEFDIDKSYARVLGRIFGGMEFSERHKLRFMFRTDTDNPSLSQLQEITDNSDPYMISRGNSDLISSYEYKFRAHFSYMNPENANVWMMLFRGDFENDYIGKNIFLAERDTMIIPGVFLPAGGQFSTNENIDGYFSLKSFMTYGMPLSFISTNLNLNLTGIYTRTPSIYEGTEQYSDNKGLGLGAVLASNISEYVDFTVSSTSNFNRAESSFDTGNNLEYFNQETGLKLSLIAKNGLFFKTDLYHNYYSGLSADYSENYILWNAAVGYKFLKNDRAELRLTAFDILKQNQSIARTVNELYIEDSITEVLQQYFMLSFSYTIRDFTLSEEQMEMKKVHDKMRELRNR